MCKVRCWRWLFGNRITISMGRSAAPDAPHPLLTDPPRYPQPSYPLGPYSRPMPRVLWCSQGGGVVSYERGTQVSAITCALPRSDRCQHTTSTAERDGPLPTTERDWYFMPTTERDWYFIAEQPAPAPHRVHPEGCAVLLIALGLRDWCQRLGLRRLGLGVGVVEASGSGVE